MSALCVSRRQSSLFFFFNAPATTEIYTLSLHDALPIFDDANVELLQQLHQPYGQQRQVRDDQIVVEWTEERKDRKSTRLNSSHGSISYAVFCLKKKKQNSNTKIIRSTDDVNEHETDG